MVHTISHTEVFEVPADDLWEVSKQMDEILPALEPELFTKSTFIEGYPGQPGSIRLVTSGPAVPLAGEWKERLDYFDEDNKACGYSILGGDPRYNNLSTVTKCVPTCKSSAEVTWTCTYEPVGDAPAPEYMKKGFVSVFRTLEKAVKSKKTMTHTESFEASPDAVWKAVHSLDDIVPKYLPDVFESTINIAGQYHGKPGSMRIMKFGPANPVGGELWERLDFSDNETKTMGVSMLKGDPRYPYFNTIKMVKPGPVEGTAEAVWTVTYVPIPNAGPPESHKQMYIQVCRMINTELKVNPAPYV